MAKTINQINEKIRSGKVVVATAEEIIDIVKKRGMKEAAQEVDIVTTGTFSPMCSSGAYINTGHAKPKIKLGGGRVYINDVPVYTGFAAVDLYIGATGLPDDDPRNKVYPGEFKYGGAHVIEDLVAGKDLKLTASAYGTDCYPRKKIETWINIKDLNEEELKSGRIKIKGKDVPTAPLSSYSKAVEIAKTLKDWIKKGEFSLSEPVASLPSADSGYTFKPLKERPIKE